MGFPTTESPINQIIDKLDSLPNSARDAAVNNSIVLSDNLGGFGESVLKLYSESSPSAREAIAEMFELVCNEPFDNWLDRVERSCDGFSKQKRVVTDAWDEKVQSDRATEESLDQMCEVAAEAVDELAAICADVQLDGNVAR